MVLGIFFIDLRRNALHNRALWIIALYPQMMDGRNKDNRGLILILSSPSGAGKTTLSRLLLQRHTQLSLSISATTRPHRPGEVDGKDYHFVTKEAFATMIQNQALMEYATVFGNQYGTPRAPVEAVLAAGGDMLFDIDWQGAQQIKLSARKDMVSVFILPPSMEELGRRLITRQTDDLDVIQKRMEGARQEISHWAEYDYVIVNQDIHQSLDQISAIMTAEKLRRSRQTNLPDFIRGLLQA
jgi:guanylate kinase